jgi:prepilin-type N-terminal cleavage/methylation domain-containing protein
MRKIKNQKGFTLIEMLIVLGIMGILITLALPLYNNTVTKAQSEGCEAIKHTIGTQMEAYYLDHNYTYPSTNHIDTLVTAKYLKQAPKCPGGGNYTVTITNGIPVVSCSEHDSAPTTP